MRSPVATLIDYRRTFRSSARNVGARCSFEVARLRDESAKPGHDGATALAQSLVSGGSHYTEARAVGARDPALVEWSFAASAQPPAFVSLIEHLRSFHS